VSGCLRRGAIYEICPRSFQDSDGDGVGDLAGVRARLPYLQELGVDAIEHPWFREHPERYEGTPDASPATCGSVPTPR
jgi:alpha-glucosidase